jgi:hypothetical protein
MKLLLDTLDTYLGADWVDKHNDPDQTARLIDQMVNQVCRVNINSQCMRRKEL